MKGMERLFWKAILAMIFLIIFLTVFSTKVWPAIRWGPFSPCWGTFVGNLGSFSDIEFLREPQTITIGDCVSAVYFVNKEVPIEYFNSIGYDYGEELLCERGGESYVIAFPRRKYEEEGWNVFNWPEKVWEEAKKFWKEDLGGVSPICKLLDKERGFVRPEYLVYDPNAGAKTYCIDIKLTKDKDAYDIIKEEGACKD